MIAPSLFNAIYLDYNRGHYRHKRPVADVRSLNLLVVIRDGEGRDVSEIRRKDDSDYFFSKQLSVIFTFCQNRVLRHSDSSDAFEHVSTMSAHRANLPDLKNAQRPLPSLEVAVYAGFCSSGLLTVQTRMGVVQNNQQFTEAPLLPDRCSTSVELCCRPPYQHSKTSNILLIQLELLRS